MTTCVVRSPREVRLFHGRWLARIVLVLAMACCAADVSAQNGENRNAQLSAEERDRLGKDEFQKGSTAYGDARYLDALAHFERAFELSGRPTLHYNIALAHDRLRHDEAALEHYDAFVSSGGDSPFLSQARARADAIRQALERRAKDQELARREAREQALKESLRPQSATNATHDDRKRRSPWFWVGIGVAVAAVGAGAAVGIALSRDDESAPRSDFGGVTQTLTFGP